MNKLTNKYEKSHWAINECLRGVEPEQLRKLITESKDAFIYCRHINDIEEMWRRITNSFWAKNYCKYIKNRPEVRKYITKPSKVNNKKFRGKR